MYELLTYFQLLPHQKALRLGGLLNRMAWVDKNTISEFSAFPKVLLISVMIALLVMYFSCHAW